MEHHQKTANPQQIHNASRYFVEERQVAWVLLLGTMLWGIFGYLSMPQRKDPEVPAREALAIVPWPGMAAGKIEEMVTAKVEKAISQNTKVTEVRSISRAGTAYVYMKLDEKVDDTGKQFDDIKMKLDGVTDLPEGAGPINFVKDFGDTAALMLTVASPPVDPVDLELRALEIREAIQNVRGDRPQRVSVVVSFPRVLGNEAPKRLAEFLANNFTASTEFRDPRPITGTGFVAIDLEAGAQHHASLLESVKHFGQDRALRPYLHPDTWLPFLIGDLSGLEAALAQASGDKYSYAELDRMTEAIEKKFKTVPQVAKVSRSGLLDEQVELIYSQERMASTGVSAGMLQQALNTRNISAPGGVVNAAGRNLLVSPSGEFSTELEIGDVPVKASANSRPLRVRDLVEIERGYANPARYLNYYNYKDSLGNWHRSRAITLDVQMRSGEQIGSFGKAVDAELASLRQRLPHDLVMARTSDQPLQVEENVHLFMSSLWEAIALVVLVSLIGFWEWRSAALMALSIPITLAMTFGMMQILGVDLQQVSIASLIIALGLLVDDPVVAGDAVKRGLAEGQSRTLAAWLGPTKLAHAILYATITNIVAYLPFLLLTGDTGRFVYTLPIVITCSLVASRLVSMTFIPMLAYYLLRPQSEGDAREKRTRGFAALYYRLGVWAIENRWKTLAASFAVLALGAYCAAGLKPQLFPQDRQYLAYVDVWLPEDAPLSATQAAAQAAEEAIRRSAKDGVLESVTSWVGGGGPRFWPNAAPEPQQLNYAQVLIKTRNKEQTSDLLPQLQAVLSKSVPNARIDVRPLETGSPVGIPVAVRISGGDIDTLRAQADRIKELLRRGPSSRVRDDWGEDALAVKLNIDPDRAIYSGITNSDVATASLAAYGGYSLASLKEGDKNIPIVAKLRLEQRSQVEDLENLYVYSSKAGIASPIKQVASLSYSAQAAKIRRFNQFRTITVSAFPAAGYLPSELLRSAMPGIRQVEASLPSGMKLEIAGEYKEQMKSFRQQAVIMGISVASIFLALTLQFKHAIKPLIVFAAIPYGVAGSVFALYLMGTPFGFMAFLGIASLVGVIVSHIIVLFDFIEERHAEGAPLREALIDAGIMRLRPVLITVGATVIALFPLASHGGPLWEPLCYAQIGGLTLSTLITLVLVPVVYAIFVLDLKWVRWEHAPNKDEVTCG